MHTEAAPKEMRAESTNFTAGDTDPQTVLSTSKTDKEVPNVKDLKQHPLSAAFPSMNDADFQALKDDIDNNGQREPVTTLDGLVLDGWHRYLACSQLGLPIEMHTFGDDDPVAFVKSVNYHRRHMSASQRAAAVVKLAQWVPPHRPNKGVSTSLLLKTNAQLAAEAGTSVKTIKHAKAAEKAGLGGAVKDGKMTAQQAANVAHGKPAKPDAKPEVKSALAAPAGWPADDGPSGTEIAAAEREAAEELEALRKIALADDKVAAALAEADRLRAMNRVLTERNNGLLNEKAELVKRIKSLQRKLEQPA